MMTTEWPTRLQTPRHLKCSQCGAERGQFCHWKAHWAKRAAKAAAAGKPMYHGSRTHSLQRQRETWASNEALKEQRKRLRDPVFQARLREAERQRQEEQRLARQVEQAGQRDALRRQKEQQARDAAGEKSWLVLMEEARVNAELTASYAREDAFRDRIEPCWKCGGMRRNHWAPCCA